MKRKAVSEWRRKVLGLGGTANEQPREREPPARMSPRSEKRARLYQSERVPLVKEVVSTEAAWRPCEGGWRIRAWVEACGKLGPHTPAFAGCDGAAAHAHEILPRGRGGSITDPRNVIGLCAVCHRWAHEHPTIATALGLLARSPTVTR